MSGEKPKEYDPLAKTAKEAIEQVALANRILAIEQLCDYLGHVSARNPENPNTYFISRSLPPENVTTKDIIELDFAGNVVTKTSMRSYKEVVIHSAIYKARPDVNSVLHSHPMPVIIFSVLNIPVKPIFLPAAIFYDGVPVYDQYDFTDKSTGILVTKKEEEERIAKCLGNKKAMIMWAHGYNVVGWSVPDLVLSAINLRDNIHVQLEAHKLGNPRYMSYEEAKHSAKFLKGIERSWGLGVARVRKTYPDFK